ncbi:MAG: hypothetical protein CM1200mP41_23830 [Gammaproteobacteria bacterium]|nr:MAG: hypothetical protein CM1200mP41_23830 [Gammaproteobacteria bacterium]
MREDFDQLIRAFDEFLKRLPFYGLAILCADDPVLQDLRKRVSNPVVTYGTSFGADYRAVEIRQKGQKMYFCLCIPGESNVEVELALAGKHNVLNALAALDCPSVWVWGNLAPILKTLSQFQGVGRRFEVLGNSSLGREKPYWSMTMRITRQKLPRPWMQHRIAGLNDDVFLFSSPMGIRDTGVVRRILRCAFK